MSLTHAHARMLGTGVGLRNPDGGGPPEQDTGSRTAGASPTDACALRKLPRTACLGFEQLWYTIDHVSMKILLREMSHRDKMIQLPINNTIPQWDNWRKRDQLHLMSLLSSVCDAIQEYM